MTIETKYNVNDSLWFIHPMSKRAVQGVVKNIQINLKIDPEYKRGTKRDLIKTGKYVHKGTQILYQMDDNITDKGISKSQSDLFLTKEELIETIIEQTKKL